MSASILEQELAELREEHQHWLERHANLEEQAATLTTLYVACRRLHSCLERQELLLSVREIIANLIGCESYALFTLSPDGELQPADSFGLEPRLFERLWPGRGLIGRSVETGEIYLRGDQPEADAADGEEGLTACIPLKREGRTTGAIALFQLLPQKFDLSELDQELFRLLEVHLPIALHCSELHERAGVGVTA